MDRTIFYPDAILTDGQLLSIQQQALIAQGIALATTLGTGAVVDGLACTPTAPASLAAVVGLGSMTQLGVVEANAFGSLPVDATPLVRQGWLGEVPITFPVTAPTSPGQSVAYLIEATLSETDGGSTVEPFYNAANPAQTFAGPNNSGAALNTLRQQRCVLKLLPGAAANTGTQTAPAADPGYVPLYVVTVAYGQTTVGAGNIVQHPQAPFLGFKLPALTPGFSRQQYLVGTGTYVVPNGVQLISVDLLAGGGPGGSNAANSGGGGGGEGGRASGILNVTPGQAIAYSVGAGGVPGGSGGSTSFGPYSATGGAAGANGTVAGNAPGGAGGVGTGPFKNDYGGYGGDGQSAALGGGAYLTFGGNGGGSGGRGGAGGGPACNGQAPGTGGGGSYGPTAATGGTGSAGEIFLQY